MGSLPLYDPDKNINRHPHVVILGAGASLAAFPNGDKNGKKLPLMNNMVDLINLRPELNKLGYSGEIDDFEELFDYLSETYSDNIYLNRIKNKIYQYFRDMQISDGITFYDKLVLSLREKDIIATFNWDPFLALAFQRNRHIKKLPQLVFLHGNVFIGICKKHKTRGFVNCACSKCGKQFEGVDLLYPIKNKNYTSSDFIRNEWELLKTYLEYAYLITIFGYSAPKTDVAAKEIMLQMWNQNQTRNFGQIEVINIKSQSEIRENWKDFFVKEHYDLRNAIDHSYLMRYPRRSCEAFASATLYNRPWGDSNIFRTNSLHEYQKRIIEIMQSEEKHDHDAITPLSKW